jgi:phosphohistidine phosphatase SixA
MNMRPAFIFMAPLLTACATVANAQQTVILVRHAEIQGAAMAAPKNLPLSADGEARAKRLAGILKDAGVDAIYATDFARTADTAAPLARELNKQVTVLPKGDPQELVDRLRKDHASQTVVLVGHTDTLPGLAKALGYPTALSIEAQDYGNIFVLTPKSSSAPSFLRLRY